MDCSHPVKFFGTLGALSKAGEAETDIEHIFVPWEIADARGWRLKDGPQSCSTENLHDLSLLTRTSPVYHQSIISISPVHHQCITSISPVYHQSPLSQQYITSTSPVHHQYITNTLPVYHQYVFSISPVHHQYITSMSPVCHQHVSSISPVCHICLYKLLLIFNIMDGE